ncbi:MAG TPA: glycosyltransferase family 4 protein [Bryobacteraceae bacterium]|nr:glycosyltransferase family 4 protein [Bryobacteraceae bacterium]
MQTLMLSPEPPYPLHSGGAYRTASLLHYLARISGPDLILFTESGQPALLPPGLVRSQQVISLPLNRKDSFARYLRNAWRALRGVPPLIDRLRGFESELERLLAGRQYDIGIVEHFWCAPYVELMARFCNKTVLDLHNVESVLHERCATFSHGAVKAGHRRFAAASRKLEARLLPRFSLVLAPSEADAEMVRRIAPGAKVRVYPNAFPLVPAPGPTKKKRDLLIFSANFEYHPNIDAVEFLLSEIWPEVRRRHPELCLRLVGRGDAAIRHLVRSAAGVETTGPIEDAFAEIAQATIVIAPLRAGSGTRLKIIEAWAAARPVVATPLAAEGLEARDGENLLLARTAGEIAGAIGRLLADPALRDRLGAAGRAAFEHSYSWEAAWAGLDLTRNL